MGKQGLLGELSEQNQRAKGVEQRSFSPTSGGSGGIVDQDLKIKIPSTKNPVGQETINRLQTFFRELFIVC